MSKLSKSTFPNKQTDRFQS